MTAIKAKHSGICPLCSKYIRKNVSLIVPLDEPLSPRGDGVRSHDDGGTYHADGTPIRRHRRIWAHARCAPRAAQPPPRDSGAGGLDL
jgi:hypothetical protein